MARIFTEERQEEIDRRLAYRLLTPGANARLVERLRIETEHLRARKAEREQREAAKAEGQPS